MKVTVRRSGGFANIPLQRQVDPAALQSGEHAELESMIRAASFPDQPSAPQRSIGSADGFQYNITLEDEGKKKTFVADEQSMPEAWRVLVDWVLSRGH